MMQQYLDAKGACGDALLLFRMGDFYELFYDDAKAAARVLGLTLTSRYRRGRFAVYGFAGTTGADHMRHLHQVWALWRRLDEKAD